MTDVVLKRGMERVEVEAANITTEILRRTFRVDPAEVWLRVEVDNRALYPDERGNFNLADVHLPFSVVLGVEGPSLPPGSFPRVTVSSSAQSTSAGSSSSYNSQPPAFKSVIPKSSVKEPKVTVKIIQASMDILPNGKVNFVSQAQMHQEISELNANVDHITKEVQQHWGSEYVLVTTDGLPLEDCDATKGFKFWKSPRRKVYAIPKQNLKRKSCRKRSRESIIQSDSEDEFNTPPERRCSVTINRIESSIETIKVAIEDIMHLNKQSKVPIAVLGLLQSSFQCKICLGIPLNPPVIISKCCKTIVGCEKCVNEWYSGSDALTKTCPSCRAERGYSQTLILQGIDEFLLEAKKLIDPEAAADGNESESDTPVVIG